MKPIWKSWTIWVNFFILMLSIFDHEFFNIMGIDETVTAKIMAVIMKVTALANIGLRIFVTDSGVNLKTSKQNDSESND